MENAWQIPPAATFYGKIDVTHSNIIFPEGEADIYLINIHVHAANLADHGGRGV